MKHMDNSIMDIILHMAIRTLLIHFRITICPRLIVPLWLLQGMNYSLLSVGDHILGIDYNQYLIRSL